MGYLYYNDYTSYDIVFSLAFLGVFPHYYANGLQIRVVLKQEILQTEKTTPLYMRIFE